MPADVVIFNPNRGLPTMQDLFEELDEIKRLAMHPDVLQLGVAQACVVAKGKMLGMFITRVQMEKKESFAHMNTHQVILQVQNELGDAAAKKLKQYARELEQKRDDNGA